MKSIQRLFWYGFWVCVWGRKLCKSSWERKKYSQLLLKEQRFVYTKKGAISLLSVSKKPLVLREGVTNRFYWNIELPARVSISKFQPQISNAIMLSRPPSLSFLPLDDYFSTRLTYPKALPTKYLWFSAPKTSWRSLIIRSLATEDTLLLDWRRWIIKTRYGTI